MEITSTEGPRRLGLTRARQDAVERAEAYLRAHIKNPTRVSSLCRIVGLSERSLRDAFYSVLALVTHLIFLAMLFLLLRAEFVAAAQVIVYAGAVMVLYVFVVAYVGGGGESAWEPIPGQRFLAPLLGIALFVELSIAVDPEDPERITVITLNDTGASASPGR